MGLRYADDTALFTENKEDLQGLTDIVQEERKKGLKMTMSIHKSSSSTGTASGKGLKSNTWVFK